MSLEGGSNRRQPTRSARMTANRPSNYYAKPFSYRNNAPAPIENELPSSTPPGFFPAISFFTDAVSALPKEMQKHFTLLKETEGKLHQPDKAVTDISNAINQLPDPPLAQKSSHAQPYIQLSLAASMSGSAAASVANGMTPHRPPTFAESEADTAEQLQSQDPHLAQREDLFKQLTIRLSEMTSALDEKNMILSAANETLARQLSRLDSVMPHIENEISEDARLGSNTHWALPHMKDMRRVNGVGASDRGRREVANVNNLAAAAAAVHEGDITATRSEARREAMLAKRSRVRDLDSDVDDRATSKKSLNSKVRKGGEAIADAKPNAGGQAQKRRKVEKPERSLAAALAGRGVGSRSSPRGSPAPDGNRKKAKATAAPAAPRRKPAVNASSITSSPTRGTFPTTSNRAQSPSRSQPSKPRHTPLQNLAQENARGRRPSSASSMRKIGSGEEAQLGNKANRDGSAVGQSASGGRSTNEQSPAPGSRQPANGTSKRRESIIKSERPDPADLKQLPKADDAHPPVVGHHSRAASRSSKPATPVVGAFAESAPMARSRSTRNGNNKESNGVQSPANAPSSPNKRSHKKGANATTTSTHPTNSTTSDEASSDDAAPRPSRQRNAAMAALKPGADGALDDPEDEDEPRYCTCNRVSFGNMIACDNDRCTIEWFHQECVGLDKPPKMKQKWFCSEKCRREARSVESSR